MNFRRCAFRAWRHRAGGAKETAHKSDKRVLHYKNRLFLSALYTLILCLTDVISHHGPS